MKTLRFVKKYVLSLAITYNIGSAMSTAVDTLPRYTSQYGRWAPPELAKLAFAPGYIVSMSELSETLS